MGPNRLARSGRRRCRAAGRPRPSPGCSSRGRCRRRPARPTAPPPERAGGCRRRGSRCGPGRTARRRACVRCRRPAAASRGRGTGSPSSRRRPTGDRGAGSRRRRPSSTRCRPAWRRAGPGHRRRGPGGRRPRGRPARGIRAARRRRAAASGRRPSGERVDHGIGEPGEAVGVVGEAPLLEQGRWGSSPTHSGPRRQRRRRGVPRTADSSVGVPDGVGSEAKPRCRGRGSSACTRATADGSLNTAVPTRTADAPARTNWSASRPVRMPPMPRIGTSGSAACTCQTQRSATGRMAGPDRPPVTPPSTGRIVSGSITIPSRVLIIDSPSAPASVTARATLRCR